MRNTKVSYYLKEHHPINEIHEKFLGEIFVTCIVILVVTCCFVLYFCFSLEKSVIICHVYITKGYC